VKNLINDFEKEMTAHGLASVSEIYDGDPPNHAKGTVAQAWSVAELLRLIKITEQFNHK
jgi:glycogen debranching enzyme